MTNVQNTTTVVGLFDSVAQAQSAVQQLVDRGIDRNQISLVSRNASGTASTSDNVGDNDIRTTSADGTTLGENVAGGALFGGLGGLLIGLAALAIPGIGPVVAAGPLATTLAGAGIGALGGGVIGGLKQAGVPDSDAELYAESVRRGGTLVTVSTNEDRAHEVSDLLDSAGAVDIDERASQYRSSGWNKFDSNAEPLPYDRDNTSYRDTNYQDTRNTATNRNLSTDRKENLRTNTGERSIPVVEEQIDVNKRTVPGRTVRVYNTVTERPVEEQVNLREEHVHVDRHPVNRAATPADLNMREGAIEMTETREEPVINKTARVVEEVTLGKDVNQRTETVRDTVRRTDVKVDEGTAARTTGSTAGSTRRFEDYDRDFRSDFSKNYASSGMGYDDYVPAYRYGYEAAGRYQGRDWSSVESDLRRDYERQYPGGAWDRMKNAIRYGWDRMTGKV